MLSSLLNHRKSFVAFAVSTSLLAGCLQQAELQNRVMTQEKSINQIWPKIDSPVKQDKAIEDNISALLDKMTIEQKVAQMIQPEIRDITVEDMRRYGFGSYLNGGGAFPNNNKHSTAQDWIDLAEAMYQASMDDSLDGISIPTMWGTDAVHGHNNVIGATLFPHNIGLGAANNPDLIEEIAQVTATEVMVTGIDWVFAPTVAAVRDDRWGRTYEGYSEDPEIIRAYSASIVKGLQGQADKDFLSDNRVISTVKHFIGDGGTEKGDDQGNNIASEQELFDIHAQGYVGGLGAGAQSVMASFNSWQGNKIHGSEYLLTDVLKGKMGFDGFVVGDWNGHGQIPGCTNSNCPQAINAGLDIYMVPTDAWKPLMENTIAQVNAGEISMSRIDDAVRRILRVKFRAGLFDKPSPAKRVFSGKTELIGADEHREVARQAVRESLVLLKNKGVLPLTPKQHVLVAGDAADNIGKQSGGWTITWQGTNNTNADFPGGSSIFDGIKSQVESAGGTADFNELGQYDEKPDVAIVIFGEEPYAEGQGDRENLIYQAEDKRDLALLSKLKADGIPVVAVFISGRPMWVNAELNASDAFVAAWLPGSEGLAVADVLFTDANGKAQHDFTGKLSFSWPKSPEQIVNRNDKNYDPLLPYGFGLTYQDENVLADDLSESFSSEKHALDNVKLFDGTLTKAWQAQLKSADDVHVIQSNAASLAGLSYRTSDRFVQEDAFRLTQVSQSDSYFEIARKAGELVLPDNIAKQGYLTFELKLAEVLTSNVSVSMKCSNACSTSTDVNRFMDTEQLDWQQVSVPLSCLGISSESGLTSGLILSADGPFDFSLFNIAYRTNVDGENTLSCN